MSSSLEGFSLVTHQSDSHHPALVCRTPRQSLLLGGQGTSRPLFYILLSTVLQFSSSLSVFLLQVTSCKTPSAEQSHITRLLRDTFSSVRQELEALAGAVLSSPGGSPGAVGAEQTQALLEQYSELLLRAVERRMERRL